MTSNLFLWRINFYIIAMVGDDIQEFILLYKLYYEWTVRRKNEIRKNIYSLEFFVCVDKYKVPNEILEKINKMYSSNCISIKRILIRIFILAMYTHLMSVFLYNLYFGIKISKV